MLRTRSGENRRGDQPDRSIHVLGLCSATASCSSCQGHAGCAITIWRLGKSRATTSRWMGRESPRSSPPPPGMPAPSPVVPVCTVTGIPSASAVSKIGYTARSSGRKPCAVGCSFRPRNPRSRTVRCSSTTAASPLPGSTDANPRNASGCARTQPATKSLVTGGNPLCVSASHAKQHTEHVRGAEDLRHLIDVVVRQRRVEIRLARGAVRAQRVVDVFGSRRMHVHIDRPH